MYRIIEKELENLFPDKWDNDNIARFIGSTKFERDEVALNEVLRKPIRDIIFRGGKRLRPTLFLTLLQGFGIQPRSYLDIAALLEVVHNGTLVIDDIEDNSALRRNKPTLHKKYGLDVAVNAGVAMHLLPLLVLLRQDTITDHQCLRLYEIYGQEISALYFGQSTDIFWHRRLPRKVTANMYFEMCRLKTGALMRMGARYACVIAGKNNSTEKAFAAFAESVGIAFQIKDDILDLKAEQSIFGKAYGNDITEGKMSLPVILALHKLTNIKKKRLRDILLMHTVDETVIKEAQELIMNTDADAQAMEYAEKLFSDAWTNIEGKIPNNKGRKRLQLLVESFITRDH